MFDFNKHVVKKKKKKFWSFLKCCPVTEMTCKDQKLTKRIVRYYIQSKNSSYVLV